jgi:heterodisulfide reductase subunit D
MNEKEILDQVNSCIECEACLEVCDTYLVSHDILKSPKGRLEIAGKIFNEAAISEEELKAIYTCTLCSLCDDFCQQEIPISEIIHASKIKLVEQNLGPLEIHNKIMQGIIEKDNSVNGDPAERLNWIPEEYRKDEVFENKNSDTLLFLGCMSSFRVKESASASYILLKKGGYDFKILEKEPCCGEYVYSSGNLDLAKKIFRENLEVFRKHGVKKIIVTCGGCLYAFNNIYPKYLESWDIEVKHVMEVIDELNKQQKLKFKSIVSRITYYDPCRTGRKLNGRNIYDEPRSLLAQCSEKVLELPKNREFTQCCGAGSGIRGVDSGLTIKIGMSVLNDSSTKELITSCPLCTFNYRYVIYKKQLDTKVKYITDYLLDALD